MAKTLKKTNVIQEILKIKKRDGRIVKFNQEKITIAISKALRNVREEDYLLSQKLSDEVVKRLNVKFVNKIPNVEDIQDIVIESLSDLGYKDVADCYQEYRNKRTQIREAKYWILSKEVKTKISENALKVLESRYLRKNDEGKLIETPQELFRRVAQNIASAEKIFKQDISDSELFQVEERFYKMLARFEFLPNSPTLMNAGNYLQQLSACFVLPVGDSLTDIFETLKQTALIHQSGGGTGFDFSHLRPRGDFVKTTAGIASGPVSFMKIFDAATQEIKQGSFRRGANMGILRVDHPDIFEFIIVKADNKTLQNFNISVAITDEFMEAYESGKLFPLRNPRTGQVIREVSPTELFDLISKTAWETGDPGLVFIDRMNNQKGNPMSSMGKIESTNPCGEVPMLAHESCNLGSINLNAVLDYENVGKYDINWEKLRLLVKNAVHFLDNVIEMGNYPIPEIERMSRGMRRIGLGIMGWADILVKLEIPYASKQAHDLADRLMAFIQAEAEKESDELGVSRGTFPYFSYSVYSQPDSKRKPRHSALTTIAPTGTISVIADCSSGIEPLFALAYIRKSRLNRNTFDEKEEWVDLLEVNKTFEEVAKREGFYSEELMKKVAEFGSVQEIKEIPERWREIFKISHDLTPEEHLNIQAIFQKHVDNAVSKTINFKNDATIEDIKNTYLSAWHTGCKGITIYRDGSKDFQVLNLGSSNKNHDKVKVMERVENNIDEVAPGSDKFDEVGVCYNCD